MQFRIVTAVVCAPAMRADDSVERSNGSRTCHPFRSEHFHRRKFAVFKAALRGGFAESRDAQIPNFIVDLAEGSFRKFMRRSELLLESRDAGESAIDLIGRQRPKDTAHTLDFGDAVTKHRQIVPGTDREADRFLQTVA